MKKLFLVLSLAVMVCFWGGQAAEAAFFTYDDFVLTFGAPNSPGAAGGLFVSTGVVGPYADPFVVTAYYQLSGTNTLAAQLVGTQYITNYNTSTLNIYADAGLSTLLWSGTGFIETIVNADQSTFPITQSRPPSFSGGPAAWNSIGDGYFTSTFNTGAFGGISEFTVPWLGTFNWGYTTDTSGNIIAQRGNAQGALVPEPGTLILLGSGLLGLVAAGRKKFRK